MVSAIRVCPVCHNSVPAGSVAAYTNGFECPHCHTRLEISGPSRLLSSWTGLVAGLAVLEFSKTSGGALNFVLPELYAILAFGAVSALVIMLTPELNVAPEEPAPAPAPAATHGHH